MPMQIRNERRESVEKEELNRIVGQYGDYVFRMCYLYLKDRYLAEDVTQETFLSVYMKYDSLRDKTQEKNWIIYRGICGRWHSV